MSSATPLPALSADEAAHSAKLLARIREELALHRGWMPFSRYMQMALYEPGLGYYSAGAVKLGAEGDFITAPEVAPVFGRCLAQQCAEVLRELGDGDLLEFGAGSGALAVSLLEELELLGALPEHYYILDVSAELRDRQRITLLERVPSLASRVVWLDALPARLRGVMIANEVLDAMPVERFVVRDGNVNALGVTWQLGRLDWSETRASEPLCQAVRAIEQELRESLPHGYTSEVNLDLPAWITSVLAVLERGVALLIDYGLTRREYYARERHRGTLLCHFRQRYHEDPFLYPGLHDIGAWVDFTAVAVAAEQAGARIAGYTTQAHFLIGNDIAGYVANAGELDLVQRLNLSRQAMLLTLPGEMGERFKVIALANGYDSDLRGFAIRDLRHTL
jgi:SAM-dependent MidA family methyltransferase